MDEYDRGIDPEIKIYFSKIIKSFSVVIMWLLGIGTAGLFFKLALVKNSWHWYHLVFYIVAVSSMVWVISFIRRTWLHK